MFPPDFKKLLSSSTAGTTRRCRRAPLLDNEIQVIYRHVLVSVVILTTVGDPIPGLWGQETIAEELSDAGSAGVIRSAPAIRPYFLSVQRERDADGAGAREGVNNREHGKKAALV